MEMALQMPSRYVEVSDDEMMYVEGGYIVDFDKKYLAWTVDISLCLFGAAKLAGGLAKALAKMGRYQLSVAITTVAYNVVRWAGANASKANILSKVNGCLGIICGFSVGNAVAYVLDGVDLSGTNNRIQF